MADDAPFGQQMAAPSGQSLPACACGEEGGMPPLQEEGGSLLSKQQKEDEMITTLVALLARRTARAYLASHGDANAAEYAA